MQKILKYAVHIPYAPTFVSDRENKYGFLLYFRHLPWRFGRTECSRQPSLTAMLKCDLLKSYFVRNNNPLAFFANFEK